MRRKSKNITKAWEIHDVIVEHGSRVHHIARSDWLIRDSIVEFLWGEGRTDVWGSLDPEHM